MGSDVCVNISCGSAASHEWKMGWPLRSGGFAQFCNNCGISKECKPDDTPDFISTFENSVFCDKFHREETGWRDCSFCNKPIHCGCIVSKSLFDFLDFGGIGCVSCIRASQYRLMQNAKKPNGAVTSTINDANDRHSSHIDGRPFVDSVDEGKLIQLCRVVEASETSRWHQPQRDEIISSSGPNSQEIKCPIREVDSRISNLMTPSIQPSTLPMLENNRTWEIKNMHELPAQPSLSMSLGIPSGNSVLPSAREIVEERLEGKQSPSFHQGQRSRLILPKPSKTGMTMNVETNKGLNSQARFARPPAEGRGKNQLLPRYWPRITDQELEQLSGNLKSNVVPLFEKVLSASDAGRIGRLVLPKACAEAYFPPISQSEGLPLRMQDVKGNEWTFQFRFWPNNNSRMYVLEGVTPCIQAMQLCAGDTVTFSRIDPGGKLVMGFRKASNSVETQDVSTSAHSNGVSMKETTFSGATENLPAGSSYSDLLHSMEGNREPQSNGLSEYLHLDRRISDLPKTENCGEMTNNNSLQQSISGSEKKRTRNIGPKSKRLLIHCEDALELRLTWEEAQDLLRPPPTVQPSIVTIEDHVFEEYNEPPVFGKRTIFSTCPSGGQEQWAPCDDCSKWRRLPVDVLLPPKWTCSENVWDSSRSSCSAPEELSPKELENLLKPSKGHLQDSKKRRVIENNKSPQELEPSGLDALASAAVLGDNLVDPFDSSAGSATTTKHPRHRPGCTCIVCIQPPSGKGKHDPACTCNVCMTVKRRFKTLMLRKKQRRSEREADATQMDQRDSSDMNGAPTEDTSHLEKAKSMNKRQPEVGESSAGQIDLNCHPEREDMEVDVPGPSMNGHLEAPNYPIQEYMNQNGPTGESQRYFSNGGSFGSIVWERERRDNEVYNEQKKNDTNSNQKTQNNPSK